jgi:hypothetical protein
MGLTSGQTGGVNQDANNFRKREKRQISSVERLSH